MKNVATAPFRIGNQPREDLLPLSRKGVFVGMPLAQYAFSPFLLSVQGLESYFQIVSAPFDGKRSR